MLRWFHKSSVRMFVFAHRETGSAATDSKHINRDERVSVGTRGPTEGLELRAAVMNVEGGWLRSCTDFCEEVSKLKQKF